MANKSDYPYLDYINTINIYNFNGSYKSIFDFTQWTNNMTATPYYECDFSQSSMIGNILTQTERLNPSSSGTFVTPTSDFVRIDVDTSNGINVTYSNYDIVKPFPDSNTPAFFTSVYRGVQTGFYYQSSTEPTKPVQTTFTDLSTAINYIFTHYAMIDLWVDGECWVKSSPVSAITSNGGGATHIAKRSGLLSSIGASNLSDILMVSGGGGGGLLSGDTDYSGKEAGGISGSGDNSADQSTGYAFGQGESGTDASGGGSGLYGGYKGTSSKSGGAGSGYIGNSLVSNKKMVGYNVPTSEAESTKTESVNEASESPVSGKPKIGNGYARIKLLQQVTELDVLEVTASSNMVDSKGVIPTVVEGGGTYTEENGYYCNSPTILEYSKNLSPSILKVSGYIDFELTGINNNGWGDSRDTGIQIRNDSDNTVIMTAVFANGNADTSTDTKEIIRVRSSADNVIYKFTNYDGSALDVNKNAWHDVKIRVYITNNKWVKGECYVDDTLWLSYDVPDDVTIEGWNGALRTRVEIIGANGIKYCKVTRKFEG